MTNTANNLRYFQTVKGALGKCDSPNLSQVNALPLPPEVPLSTGEGSESNQNQNSNTNASGSSNQQI
jgi:hypothetical protein